MTKTDQKGSRSLQKMTPDLLVEFVEKNKVEFCKALNTNKDLVIKKTATGLKKATINY